MRVDSWRLPGFRFWPNQTADTMAVAMAHAAEGQEPLAISFTRGRMGEGHGGLVAVEAIGHELGGLGR